MACDEDQFVLLIKHLVETFTIVIIGSYTVIHELLNNTTLIGENEIGFID